MFRVHGHELAVRSLSDGLRRGRLHHAYLLAGSRHVGKTTLAVQLAQAVNCTGDDPPCGGCSACHRIALGTHADIRTIGLEVGDEDAARAGIGIDSVRALQSAAYLKPYEGKAHVFIVQDAGRLSVEAANALLKLLEEPPPEVLLVLLTTNVELVLQTIVSRCQLMELRPLPLAQVAHLLQREYDVPNDRAWEIARLSRGCVGWAIDASQGAGPLATLHQQMERIAKVTEARLDERFVYAEELARRFFRDRGDGRQELASWLQWWRDVLLVQSGLTTELVHESWRGTIEAHAQRTSPPQTLAWLKRLYQTMEALDQNANPRLALEALMLDLPMASPGR